MAKVNHVVRKKQMNDAINDDTAGPKYVIDETKGLRKRSFIWKFFAPFNIAFHPLMKEHRICLICREKGIDKALKVGEKCSTGNLITHLCTHPKENEEYMKSTAEAEEESDAKKHKSLQMTINFPVFTSVRDNFLNACAKWVVEDFQPFNVGESKSFKAMIKALNPKLNPPDAKTLKRKLHLMKATASANMKIFLSSHNISGLSWFFCPCSSLLFGLFFWFFNLFPGQDIY
jgi:hypothetical protein